MSGRIDDLLVRMTTDEKVAFVAGEDLWHRPAVERLGIPAMRVTDGPNGARGTTFNGSVRGVCVPCGTALAATWDPALVHDVGALLGRETRRRGASVLLAPTVNLHRNPLAGRNFECYSEDPELSARMAVAYIRGVQSEGVAATVKHLVANDSEFERHTISSDVGERALRELYLRPFEAAVREAGVWAVMAAYNRLNGTYCSEHPWLLGEVLRGEWGFDGAVMSDWWGLHATAGAVDAGLDLEMPGPSLHRGAKLRAALDVGQVDESILDERVRALLVLAERTGALDAAPGPETTEDVAAERALVRRAAVEGTVLLENQGVLPLDTALVRHVAVLGAFADRPAIQGGGSAHVTPVREASFVDALRARLRATGGTVTHEPGPPLTGGVAPLDVRHVRTTSGEAGFDVAYTGSRDRDGEVVLREVVRRPVLRWWGRYGVLAPGEWTATVTTTFVAPAAGRWVLSAQAAADVELSCDGADVDRLEVGEGRVRVSATADLAAGDELPLTLTVVPRPGDVNVDLDLRCRAPEDPGAFDRAVAAARAADAAVVVVGLDERWESEGFDRTSMALPGRQADLVEAVTAVNERTIVIVNAGSPVDVEWADRVGALLYAWYPGQEAGEAWADIVVGDAEAGGRLPTTFPRRVEDSPTALDHPEGGHLLYGEGLYIGYRWYTARALDVRYPFGFGLSTTELVWGPPAVELVDATAAGDPDATVAVVDVPVTGTGGRDGTDVVQVYVADVEASARRPVKELGGFAKVHVPPGATVTARVAVPRRCFRFWDPDARAWTVEPGRFELLVARSAADVVAAVPLDLV